MMITEAKANEIDTTEKRMKALAAALPNAVKFVEEDPDYSDMLEDLGALRQKKDNRNGDDGQPQKEYTWAESHKHDDDFQLGG